ncbi:MAG: 4Fe-4S ferredoxin [Desulfobacteraceae bacterium]|jgi:NAD-dependent dihydropyrimidine dehydrogenase PreA subunit|nr:MAG: 4Fe-4S ferredoxin [Desulfobacteraceae bacterium]
MKVKRKIIEIDSELCDGCGQCVPACAEGAIEVVDGKARLSAERYCDGLGACLGECPNGALRIIEREAEDFDAAAVEEYLKGKDDPAPHVQSPQPMSCPSTRIQTFIPMAGAGIAAEVSSAGSGLSHWPVQINLVPPAAPFLKGARLLVAADCTPFAYPSFHRDFLAGRVVMVGCPKFDDVPGYVQKFTEIFVRNEIKEIVVVVMEVPCCSALPMIIKKAMAAAGKKIPVEEVVIGTRGDILQRRKP